jgi:hypothetical protein
MLDAICKLIVLRRYTGIAKHIIHPTYVLAALRDFDRVRSSIYCTGFATFTTVLLTP